VKAYVDSISDSGWTVIIYQSLAELRKQMWFYISIIIVIAIMVLIVTLYLSRVKIRRITSSLSDLAQGTQIISAGEYYHELKESRYNEVEELRLYFAKMTENIKNREKRILENEEEILKMNEYLEDQVMERTKALKQSNEELYKTIDELTHTQEILIQSEKMASLGQLVAGVTHEMMTPIGIIVTLSSHMEQLSSNLEKHLKAGKLTKSELLSFVADQREAVEVIVGNAHRTKEFVTSLKKTSVDQVSMEKRAFVLCDTINDAVRSMKMELKHAGIKVNVACSAEIELESYPGGISQIILNLMNNAIQHAYSEQDDNDDKKIVILAELDVERLRIVVEDNGVGMNKEVQNMIYEPFYTTARETGGSGIGMSIIKNLVENIFKGHIECNSVIGRGTEFIIMIPAKELIHEPMNQEETL